MSIIQASDSDCANMNNTPVGMFYYLIPKDNLNYGKFLGHNPNVVSLIYNPFLNIENVTSTKVTYDVATYGEIDNSAPELLRIMSTSKIDEVLTDTIKVFLDKSEFNYDDKLQLYPYRFFLITDYINPPLLIKPELVSGHYLRISITTTAISGYYKLYCKNYKNDANGLLEGVTNQIVFNLPVTSSAYSEFLATSNNSYNTAIQNSLLENDLSLKQGARDNSLNLKTSLTSNVLSGIASLLTGNIGGVVGSAVEGGMSFASYNNNKLSMQESADLKEQEIVSSSNAKINDLLQTPNSLKTSGNDTIYNMEMTSKKIDVVEYTLQPRYLSKIDKYFKYYGYLVDDWGEINIKSKWAYNYIKTSIPNIIGDEIPENDLQEIKEIFNSGITFWHVENGVQVLNYNYDNVDV